MLYDRIGAGYREYRRPDPRIAAKLHDALGDAARVVNVGAGAGSYERAGRTIVAVEPSLTMITQRPRDAAPAVAAVAERLPFRDRSFDAATALLTIHHWSDPAAGLGELARVAPLRVVFAFDVTRIVHSWIVSEYLPAIGDIAAAEPSLDEIASWLGGDVRFEPVPVPADCTDGFLDAYWARPEAYLDPGVRSAISGIAMLPASDVAHAVARLERDLRTGAWDARHGHLRAQREHDAGYVLIVSRDPLYA